MESEFSLEELLDMSAMDVYSLPTEALCLAACQLEQLLEHSEDPDEIQQAEDTLEHIKDELTIRG